MPNSVFLISPRNQVLLWLAGLAFVAGFVWLFSDILLPFVLGAIIAYLLDPAVEWLARRKIPRTAATILILGLFFAIVIAALALIFPLAAREAARLADALPGYADKITAMIAPYSEWLQQRAGLGSGEQIVKTLQGNAGNALKISGGVLAGFKAGGQAIIGFITTAALTPIVAFFMIREWPRMTGWVDSMLPRRGYDDVRTLLVRINGKISGFIRGQFLIAAFLAVIYAGALTAAGLDYGFFIGIAAGLLSIIPLLGSLIGLVIAVIVAWFQAGDIAYTGMIAAIFLAGQFVEGNFLTPKILGENVGLHPLWILFALMAGAAAFGITGMLIAVPLAASIGVLASYALGRYRASEWYGAEKITKKKL